MRESLCKRREIDIRFTIQELPELFGVSRRVRRSYLRLEQRLSIPVVVLQIAEAHT